MDLRQSTAVVVSFGPFLDKADGLTLKTGLVSAIDHVSTGIMLAKNGGVQGVRHATVTASTYDANGCYRVTLDATDTATLGTLRTIYTDATTCLPVWQDFMVLPAAVWDALYGSAVLPANATQFGGQAVTAAAGVTVLASVGTAATSTAQTGDNFARIGVAGAGLTALGDTRIAHLDADVSSRSTYAGGAVASVTAPVTAGTVTDKTGYALTAAYDPAKTAAQAGDAMALTSGERTTLVAAVWAAAGRTLTSFGTLVADASTAVWGAVARSLTDKAGFSLASAYDAAKTAGDATAANQTTINSNVLTRLATSGYTAPDNAGIASIESAVTALPTANANADALLDRTAGVETGWTIRQSLRIILGVLAGKTTGANTTAMAFRNTADTKNRVAVTLDSDGNRTAVSTDAS